MKRTAALLCIAGLLTAGCKTTGDDVDAADTTAAAADSTAGDGATTTAAATADSTAATDEATTTVALELGQGVTDDAIKVGVTYPDLSKIRDVLKLDHGDYFAAFQDLADDINANGGINGRKIELVDGPADVTDPNAVASTCTKFTEDEKVFAVIGSIQADAVSCYVEQHDVALIGGQQSKDLIAAAKAPWFGTNPTLDKLAVKTVEGVAAEGGFDGKKIGLVSLPIHESLVADSIDPTLDKVGIELTDRAVIDSPAGDQAAAQALTKTILEKFRSDGVDTLLLVGDTLTVVAQALESSDYRPLLIGTDNNPVGAFVVGRDDTSMLTGLITGSRSSRKAQWEQAGMPDCLAKITAAEPDRQITDPVNQKDGELDTFVSVLTACSAMSVFEAIAEAAGPNLNNDTFRAAGQSLGKFDVPGTGGGQNYTADDPSGDAPVYLARYDEAKRDTVPDETPVS